ncbi:MAG: T9SS type A sorting domain-containing protein [candidate division Zixibacteria bacterium]|nr:T9SS type A sorting domain-containing protein [candidate division Zixibacteria bacterium]
MMFCPTIRQSISWLIALYIFVSIVPISVFGSNGSHLGQSKCDERCIYSKADERITGPSLVSRLNMHRTFISPDGYFKIHYDTSGADVVYMPHKDIQPQDGHPDFVNRCGEYFDSCWNTFNTIGFTQPPSDGDNGGDYGLYDIYMHHYAGVLGIALAEDSSDQYPDRSHSYTSYIYVDPDFEGFGYTDREVPLRIAAAHNYHHAVQYGYNLQSEPWIKECSATWAEEAVFDDINANYIYLHALFDYPHVSHSYENGSHEFAMFVYLEHLTQNYGLSALAAVWENLVHMNAEEAINQYLNSQQSSIYDHYRSFMIWNYFTGIRDDGNHYEEGDAYPLVHFMQIHTGIPIHNQEPSEPPSDMGGNYVLVTGLQNYEGSLFVDFNGANNAVWAMDALAFVGGEDIEYFSELCDEQGEGRIRIDLQNSLDSLGLIFSLLSGGEHLNYLYSVRDDSTTSVEDIEDNQPIEFYLTGNYPNPFNSTTTIVFHSPTSGEALFEIFNIAGQCLETNRIRIKTGINRVTWDAKGKPSGHYLYRIGDLRANSLSDMLLVK